MNNQLSRSIKSLAAIVAALLCYTTNSLQAYTLGNFTYSETATTIIITRCSKLAAGPIVIPAEITGKPVTRIRENAFTDCDRLTSLTIPSSVTVIGDGAFSSCDKLTAITADPANANYSSIDGILFDKALINILQFPGGISGSYSIPTNVTTIGHSAFKGCSGLTSVTIPSNVTRFLDYAFSGCSGLTHVTIPSSVTHLGGWVFDFCSGLTSVAIPSSITVINTAMFRGCTSLTSVTIPSSIIKIWLYAFDGCSSLTSVTIPSSVTSIYPYAFIRCSGLKTVLFLGNAPEMDSSAFYYSPEGFKINYIAGKLGFNSPKWKGYPCFPATPDITVQQPLGTSLVDGMTKKSFGTVLVGSLGRAKFFTVKNDGLAELTSLAISIDGANAGDFTLSALPRTSLLPGTATKYKVTFNPSATGTRTATLHIASNDADENPFDIELTGLGAP